MALIQVEHLKKYFETPKGLLHAVDDVSFSIDAHKTLGVVGESGCGKSTLGRLLLHLLDNTGGKIIFEGEDISNIDEARRRSLCPQMQMIFQDPFSSIDPRKTVFQTIAEPLQVFRQGDKRETERQVTEIMDTVGIAKRIRNAYPHELDGGRRQRVGIARALILKPRFIVCDEPVSALDVSIQAQIINLMLDLQAQMGLTYVFITHDMSVVRHVSHDILVMYLGQMVESCECEALFQHPMHPYTKALLSAVPVPDIDRKKQRILLRGEITSPINPKPGCRFAARCNYAKPRCFEENVEPREVCKGHKVACHFVEEINEL